MVDKFNEWYLNIFILLFDLKNIISNVFSSFLSSVIYITLHISILYDLFIYNNLLQSILLINLYIYT